MPGFHHVELWVDSYDAVRDEWAWLLARIGFALRQEWPGGGSWESGGAYLTLTESPNTRGAQHDRRRPGLNHLAFSAGTPADVDRMVADAPTAGWRALYQDRYPHAGGPDHYAGWLENGTGFKVELVACTG